MNDAIETSLPERACVVALHCSLGSGRQWTKLATALLPDRQLIAPDLAGYGSNPVSFDLPTTLAQEVESLSEALAESKGPIHLSGHENQSSDRARAFGKSLAELTGLPVLFWDERFTTVEAEAHLLTAGLTNTLRVLGKTAAAYVLVGDILKGIVACLIGLQLGVYVYSGGARVERLYAFGPPSGAACNVTLISHNETCCIGIVVDTTAVPDPDVLVNALRAGFDEVLALG